jgi:hypothetical protein
LHFWSFASLFPFFFYSQGFPFSIDSRWQESIPRLNQAKKKKKFNLSHKRSINQSTINMPVPEYGAAPLAKTFVLVRGLSLISIICQ